MREVIVKSPKEVTIREVKLLEELGYNLELGKCRENLIFYKEVTQ